jgi:hypothetical protein
MKDINVRQNEICSKYGVAPSPPDPLSKVGIAQNVRSGLRPINGLRHPPEGDTNGWYIWAGEEFSEDPNFFVPLHTEHIKEWCPEILPYLALPPGWRFLVTPDYEDVWFDEKLLITSQ